MHSRARKRAGGDARDATWREPGETWTRRDAPEARTETGMGTVAIDVSDSPFRLIRGLRRAPETWTVSYDADNRSVRYGVSLLRRGDGRDNGARLELGYAVASLRKVADLEFAPLKRAVGMQGVGGDETLSMIDFFYPIPNVNDNGVIRPVAEYARQGIGSAVLREVLRGLRSEGAAAAYGYTRDGTMQGLLARAGFALMDGMGRDWHGYLVLLRE